MTTADWRRRHKARLFAEQGGRCDMTFKPDRRQTCTIDHVIPRRRGGRGLADNHVAACWLCNHLKGDMLPAAFEAFRAERRWRGRPWPDPGIRSAA